MYDLHCHLLPGIDDGPVDLATALEMARMAVTRPAGIAQDMFPSELLPPLPFKGAKPIRSRDGETGSGLLSRWLGRGSR